MTVWTLYPKNVYDDVFMFLTFCINGRLNPQNEAAKRGLERLEKQMKVGSFYSFTRFLLIKSQFSRLPITHYLHFWII